MPLKGPSRLVLLVAGALMAVVLVAPLVAPYGQRCTSCHTESDPGGGYVFTMPYLELDCPAVAPPGQNIEATLTIKHPGAYELRRPVATVELVGSGALAPGENAAKALGKLPAEGGSASVSWNILTANASGPLVVTASLNFTARYRHTNTNENDESPYLLGQSCEMSVRPVALYADEGIVHLQNEKEEASFDIVTSMEARNITLRPSSNLVGALELAPSYFRSLPSGQRQTIKVNAEDIDTGVNNGRIDIVWQNATGANGSTFVTVRFSDEEAAPVLASTPVRLTGRITGLLSFALLLSSLALGMVKLGGKRRARVHCAVSWFILGLSVYHGLMLVLGPYSKFAWGQYILLGYFSAAVMGVSGVNGVAQEWMSRVASYRAWLWLHRIATIIALVLVVVHAVALGTDFAPLRDLLPGHRGNGDMGVGAV